MKARLWIFQSGLPNSIPLYNIDVYPFGEIPKERDPDDRGYRFAHAIKIQITEGEAEATISLPSHVLGPDAARDFGYCLSQAGWVAGSLARHCHNFPTEVVEVDDWGAIYRLFGGPSYGV